MARGEGALRRGGGGVEDVGEVGERTGMHAWILVGVLIGIGMLDHAAKRQGFEDDPGSFPSFEVIGNLHAHPLRSAVPRPEFDFGAGLTAVDRDAVHIHVHGAHVEGAHTSEMLHDARADGLPVALLLLASACDAECGEQPRCYSESFHKPVLFRSIKRRILSTGTSVSLGDSPVSL